MTLSENNKKFLEDLIEYYINESQSYIQMAEEFSENVNSKTDTAFGIIIGIVYSSFLQMYANQALKVELEDIQEFYDLIKTNSNKFKESFKEIIFLYKYSGFQSISTPPRSKIIVFIVCIIKL